MRSVDSFLFIHQALKSRHTSLGVATATSFSWDFDAQNDLYLGHRGLRGGSITVYPPGSDKPIHRITKGIDNLQGLAISPG